MSKYFLTRPDRVIMAEENTVATIPQQQLLDLINTDNGTTFTLDEIILSDPVPSEIDLRNTKVTLTCKPDSPYFGTVDLFYNRLALSRLGYVGIITPEPINEADFFNIIQAQKEVELIADEFLPISVPVLENGATGKIQLIAKPTAIKWYGSIEVDYSFGVPAGLDLLHELIHVTLPAPGYLT